MAGHVGEVGDDLGNGLQAGQWLKGCLPLKKLRTVSHYHENLGDTHPVLPHAGRWCIC